MALLFGVWFCIMIALCADNNPRWARNVGGVMGLLTVAVPMAAYCLGVIVVRPGLLPERRGRPRRRSRNIFPSGRVRGGAPISSV
jgi:hypothetical protein